MPLIDGASGCALASIVSGGGGGGCDRSGLSVHDDAKYRRYAVTLLRGGLD